MATDAERQHARKLLGIHQANLRKLEERAATYAGDVPLHIANQMDEERANIAALEPISKPPPSQQIQKFVTNVSDGNGGNWAMMFSQYVLLNTRMTKAEEQNQRILDEQARASLWRMQAGHDIQALQAERGDRVRGQQRNLVLLGATVTLLLVLSVLVVVLVAR